MRITDLYENKTKNIPIIKYNEVFHVGSMDASAKREGSYEGAGLSVSRHPNAWRLIARGHVTGGDWVLTKPNGRFLNMHEMPSDLVGQIKQWGISNGYLESATTYRVSYYDDEMEDTMTMVFHDQEEAEEEAEAMDGEIEVVEGDVKATTKLVQRTKGADGTIDALAPVWVEDTTDLDGVWWMDELDPSRYSAPRGVIVPSKLSSWKVTQTDAPDDDDYGYED